MHHAPPSVASHASALFSWVHVNLKNGSADSCRLGIAKATTANTDSSFNLTKSRLSEHAFTVLREGSGFVRRRIIPLFLFQDFVAVRPVHGRKPLITVRPQTAVMSEWMERLTSCKQDNVSLLNACVLWGDEIQPVYTVFKISWQCMAADLLMGNLKGDFASYSPYHLTVMLGVAAFVVFGLLPAYVAGQLMTTDAKCLSGYEWVCFILQITDFVTHFQQTFNTQNQSPCDVAASLAAVCAPGGRESCLFYTLHIISVNLHAGFNLDPLPSGYVYSGPLREFATPCRCSTVYYSMLSACGYCQFRNFLEWTFCCWRLSLIAYIPF